MVWYIITRIFLTMLDLITKPPIYFGKRLKILVLRLQLALLQRKLNSPIRPRRIEKTTLAVLTAKLKKISHQTTSQLQSIIRNFQPETVLRWQRELIRLK